MPAVAILYVFSRASLFKQNFEGRAREIRKAEYSQVIVYASPDTHSGSYGRIV